MFGNRSNERGIGMKKRIIYRGMAFALIGVMGLTSACGKKGGGTEVFDGTKLTDEDKQCIYSMGDAVLSADDDSYISNFTVANGCVYGMKSVYSTNETFIIKAKPGSEVEELSIGKSSGGFSPRSIAIDDKENVYIYEESYMDYSENYDGEILDAEETSTEGESELEEASSTTEVETEAVEDSSDESSEAPAEDTKEDESSDVTEEISEESDGEAEDYSYSDGDNKSRIRKLDATGNEVWSTEIVSEDQGGMLYNMVWVKDYGLLTSSEKGFCKYSDADGKGEFLFSRNKNSDDYRNRTLFVSREGKVYLYEPDDDWNACIFPYDTKTQEFGEKVIIPSGDNYVSEVYAGFLYDFYYRTSDAIKGFNIGEDTDHRVCDITLSDMEFDYIEFAAGLDENTIAIYGSIPDEPYSLVLATKVDPSEVVDKQILTVGLTYIDDGVRKAILKFNKTNNEYRIKIKNYSDMETEETDSTTLMNLDISSGNIPDIMVLNAGAPFESYLDKGLFEPLDSYLEKDENLSADDILPNVLRAGKRDDKLYLIIPSYYIQTSFGSKAMLGDDIVTWQNYKEICERNNIDPTKMFGETYRDSAYSLFTSAYETFIDWDKGTCNFKDPSFIAFLEYIKTLPAEPGDNAYSDYETQYREKKALLMNYWVSNFDDYQLVEKGYFGEDIVVNGFPGVDEGFSFLQPETQLAISAKCKNKDAAWQFVSSMLSKEFQDKIEYNLPARKDSMDEKTQKAKEPPYYIDENGEKQISYSTWGIGDDIEVEMRELDSDDADRIREFFESVDKLPHYDSQLENIMQEELPSFYDGQKTAEEVADIIQSRVSIYLSESR